MVWKTLKFFLSLTVLTVMVVSQIPTSANSQMICGGIFSKSGEVSSQKMTLSLNKTPSIELFSRQSRWFTFGSSLVNMIEQLIAGPSRMVRVPPSDVQLLDA